MKCEVPFRINWNKNLHKVKSWARDVWPYKKKKRSNFQLSDHFSIHEKDKLRVVNASRMKCFTSKSLRKQKENFLSTLNDLEFDSCYNSKVNSNLTSKSSKKGHVSTQKSLQVANFYNIISNTDIFLSTKARQIICWMTNSIFPLSIANRTHKSHIRVANGETIPSPAHGKV